MVIMISTYELVGAKNLHSQSVQAHMFIDEGRQSGLMAVFFENIISHSNKYIEEMSRSLIVSYKVETCIGSES